MLSLWISVRGFLAAHMSRCTAVLALSKTKQCQNVHAMEIFPGDRLTPKPYLEYSSHTLLLGKNARAFFNAGRSSKNSPDNFSHCVRMLTQDTGRGLAPRVSWSCRL